MSLVSEVAITYDAWQPELDSSDQETVSVYQAKSPDLHESFVSCVSNYVLKKYALPHSAQLRVSFKETTLTAINENREKCDYIGYEYRTQDQLVFFLFRPALCLKMIEFYYGGLPTFDSPPIEKENLGDFDVHAISAISKELFIEFAELLKLQPGKMSEEIEITESVYLFSIHFEGLDDTYEMQVILSQAVLAELFEEKKVDTLPEKNIDIHCAQVEISTLLFQKEFDLSYVLSLVVGDLIPIKSKDAVELRLNNETLYRGVLGEQDHLKAVKISDVVLDEKKRDLYGRK